MLRLKPGSPHAAPLAGQLSNVMCCLGPPAGGPDLIPGFLPIFPVAAGQLSNVMGCLTTYGIGSAPPFYGTGYVPQASPAAAAAAAAQPLGYWCRAAASAAAGRACAPVACSCALGCCHFRAGCICCCHATLAGAQRPQGLPSLTHASLYIAGQKAPVGPPLLRVAPAVVLPLVPDTRHSHLRCTAGQVVPVGLPLLRDLPLRLGVCGRRLVEGHWHLLSRSALLASEQLRAACGGRQLASLLHSAWAGAELAGPEWLTSGWALAAELRSWG